jgi:mandelate racemase
MSTSHIPHWPVIELQSSSVSAVSVPLAYPIRTASGIISHAPLILIDLMFDHDVVGRSYLFTYSPVVQKAMLALVSSLLDQVPKQPLSAPALYELWQQRFRLLGLTGLITMAASGIDMAWWDGMAKSVNKPLCDLLGHKPAPMPAYLSLGLDGIEQSKVWALQCIEQGFPALKLKAGYPDPADDVRMIQEVQAIVGSKAKLAVDFNQSLNRSQALSRCQAIDDLGLLWIEEPLAYDDDEGHQTLVRILKTDVMIGENWFGHEMMSRSVAAKTCKRVMPDVMKIGGVTGWLRAAQIAADARLSMSSHLFPEISVHLLTATPTAGPLEYLDLAAPVLREPFQVANGQATAKPVAGYGLEWDQAAVKRYALG